VTTENPEEFLAHFGVKGMKWGVRKSSPPVHLSGDRKKLNTVSSKPVESMTNRQLKEANSRLQMEKQYKDLTKQPSAIDKINAGNNKVRSILAIAGTATTVYTMATSPAGKAAVKAGRDIIARARA
jgi:hypothetical protein